MILFKEDWDKYPTAIADGSTTNPTFLRTVALYKRMDVKNAYWPLTLMQSQLRGVDPYSKDLTLDQKTMIYNECKYNPWYFYREVLRIPSGSSPLRFRINRATASMLWCFFNNIDYSITIPRQFGKSITGDAINIWLLVFGVSDTELFLFTKDISLRKKNIKRIKETLLLLPNYLNPTNKDDLDNTEVVTMVAQGNILKCAVGQAAFDRADNIGRGETLPITQTDEGPHIPNVNISMPVILAATTTARENSEIAGSPYGNFYTSTAGKRDTPGGGYMYNLIHKGMYWTEKLLDTANKEQLKEVVALGCKSEYSIINGTFSHRQLGHTDVEFARRVALTNDTKESIDRNYYNRWSSGSEASPLSVELNDVIERVVREPNYVEITKENYTINWYIPEHTIDKVMDSVHHIISLDSSNAKGLDGNSLIITDIRDLSIVATSIVNEANLHNYAIWLANLLIRYLNTTLIIENKSSGQGIIDTVAALLYARGMDPFKRMFNYIVDEQQEHPREFSEISISKSVMGGTEAVFLKYAKRIGFMTNGNRRKFLYDTVLVDAAKSTGHLVIDATLSNEIRSLVYSNGRVDHVVGGHDDSVFAWMLAHWFIKHARNLSYYGINPAECLSMVSADGAILDDSEIASREELFELTKQIDSIKESLLTSPNVFVSKQLSRQLAHTINKMNGLGDTAINLNNIMDEVNNSKVKHQSLRNSIAKVNRKRT